MNLKLKLPLEKPTKTAKRLKEWRDKQKIHMKVIKTRLVEAAKKYKEAVDNERVIVAQKRRKI
jgi:hypothetical protein